MILDGSGVAARPAAKQWYREEHMQRREFLQVGALSFLGLTLADVLHADTLSAGVRSREKSWVHVGSRRVSSVR